MGGIPTESISLNLQLASGQIRRVNVVHQKPMEMRFGSAVFASIGAWLSSSARSAPRYPLHDCAHTSCLEVVQPWLSGRGTGRFLALLCLSEIMRLGSICDSRSIRTQSLPRMLL